MGMDALAPIFGRRAALAGVGALLVQWVFSASLCPPPWQEVPLLFLDELPPQKPATWVRELVDAFLRLLGGNAK